MKNTLLIMIIALLTGCAGMGTDQTIGTVSGGGLGMLAGSQIGQGTGRTAAMIGGTAIGALMGSSIGQSMDKVNEN